MNSTQSPLRPGMTGADVIQLQDVLKQLVEQLTIDVPDVVRQALEERLAEERRAGSYGDATRTLVTRFQERSGLSATGDVDEATAARLLAALTGSSAADDSDEDREHLEVRGTIRRVDGRPAPGYLVLALDQRLRRSERLGAARTSLDGSYHIEYSLRRDARLERGGADVLIQVVDHNGDPIAASPILFNATRHARIDLTLPVIPGHGALYDTIATMVTPRLEGVAITDLEENAAHRDLSFLMGETGLPKSPLVRYALAHRLATDALPAEFWFALLGAPPPRYDASKGLAEQLPALLDQLSTLDGARAGKTLALAIEIKDIDARLEPAFADWVAAFVAFLAARTVADGAAPNFLKQSLVGAGIDSPERQQSFAALYNQYHGFTADLLAALDKDAAFKPAEVADIHASYRLADVTGGDFAVVQMIKQQFDIHHPEELPTLARQTEAAWIDLVRGKVADGTITVPFATRVPLEGGAPPHAESYGRYLARQFRTTYPTAAFSGDLKVALGNGGAHGVPEPDAMQAFLDAHADFDLQRTPVDAYLDNQVKRGFKKAAKDPAFRKQLKAVQRVFKLAPSFAAADALLADGVHSAQMVYRIGQSGFVRRYTGVGGFTAETAQLAWNRAAETHAATLTILGDLKSYDGEAVPQVLRLNTAALANFPNWDNLFQGGDICNCEDCRSVLSPAAYYADLLMFLKDRKAANPAQSVKDILFARRPQLGYLELNCDNALTPLPYVDIVCEVLEAAMTAGASDVELPGFGAMPANPAAASAAVSGALAAQGISLGTQFTLSQVDPADPDRWVAHGDGATYLLKKKGTPNFFAQLLPNTKAGAAELRAYPAYVDAKAYETLRTTRFPFALPFDLFAEEVRAAFAKCNLQRWDLMRVLRGNAAPVNPTDGQIAAEYFGISCDAAAAIDERRLIIAPDPTDAGQQEIWGETGNAAWLATVANVKTFLNKTGLEYEDLPALLDLQFINPAGDITIDHLDNSCDTAQKTLTALDTAKLDRFHRFLRMWRKLPGWATWELDLAIRTAAIGGGTIDEPFLIHLYYFGRLRSRLGAKVSVEQLCALFSDLDTETHYTKAFAKRAPGLYQNLFLNRKVVQPLDDAFDVAAVDVVGPTAEKISGHRAVVLAALDLRQTDLDMLIGPVPPAVGAPYITDDLTLGNLSFLWRHSWLARTLKLRCGDWRTCLKILNVDLHAFAGPQAAFEFVESLDRLRAAGFTPDELAWLLAADRTANAATKEDAVARVLGALRTQLQAIRKEFDPAGYSFLSPPSDVDALSGLLISLTQRLNRDEAGAQFILATLRDEVEQQVVVAGLPVGFAFPAPISTAIRIRYDEPAGILHFTGLMMPAQLATLQTDPTLAAVTGIAAYQQAIGDLYATPRLAFKFYDPTFTAPLQALPAAVDFKTLPDPMLVQKVSYDPEQRLLQFTGILSQDQKQSLDALSADGAYRAAVNSLYTQPSGGAFSVNRLWLSDADLTFPLRDLANAMNDHLATNLATAITKALGYLGRTSAEEAVIQVASGQFGLTDALTRQLFTAYAPLPGTLLAHFTGSFASTSGVVDYATLPTAFDGWFWAGRVASLWKKWKLSFQDWQDLGTLQGPAQLLDEATLPLNAAVALPSATRFARSAWLLRMRNAIPETSVGFLDVMLKLAAGGYAAVIDFAADVENLNPDWAATDVATLVNSLDAAYPGDYLLADTWDRLQRAFYFLGNLGGGASAVRSFAAPTMAAADAKTLKDLLRSAFGVDTWLPLCVDIEDALRERKRSALTAYLLSQPMPADAPTGKWDDPNDLYAYHLLDVQMCACQLTSRLVQASGSVQLFVQRCFMGLEPAVKVEADGVNGDTAWRWWTWMRKYRVWEANREVWLWPENVIAPELKRDRSTPFRELESELAQNDMNTDTVETAFIHYLQKVDSVAQLQVAGFYQEDQGDDTIVHVFGRTDGAEPHVYHYRRYDYRQWTPWEKVDLDIQGDYLVPAVINGRLFLFWPVFTEMPDEAGNNAVNVPHADQSGATMPKTSKKLRLQMAVSDFRQGKWTPKRVSKGYLDSAVYDVEVVRRGYRFFPVDRSSTEGRFAISLYGSSFDASNYEVANLTGAFEISGCNGTAEPADLQGAFVPVILPTPQAVGSSPVYLHWQELDARMDAPDDDFSLESSLALFTRHYGTTPILVQTPWIFHVAPPWQLTYLDQLVDNGILALQAQRDSEVRAPLGSWAPFFYNDRRRTFFVLPCLRQAGKEGADGTPGLSFKYYPEIKRWARTWVTYFEGVFRTWANAINLAGLTPAQRSALEAWLVNVVPSETAPPFTDNQVRDLLVAYLMQFVDLFLGELAFVFFLFRQFHFKNFYHPFTCAFAAMVEDPLKGIPGLMKREVQLQQNPFQFKQSYQPTPWVVDASTTAYYPVENVDFTPDGAYASYNWEVFFHAPLLIANALSRNQRFEEARNWYHYMFNPIGVESATPGGSVMSKYWITKKFFETTDAEYLQQRIDNILALLAGDTSAPGYSVQAQQAIAAQVRDWRDNPFDPHRIAAYRTVAYQKTVVMRYLDNLIAWGDYLFQQDSMESINEATQLYVLAAEILGPPPRKVPPRAIPPLESFNELEQQFDAFSNALVEVENLVPPQNGGGPGTDAPLPMLYFCIPRNRQLLAYWDTVADRLYKIRHCMNIQGVVRQLALFEPPIDPAALVKATAAGIDINTALADLASPLPLYRFNIMLQKANELCADVRSLGGALLVALEKRDGETLALLRQTHELRLLTAVKALREIQISDAQEMLESSKRGKELAQIKQAYYASRPFMNAGEIVAVALNSASMGIDAGIALGYSLAGGLKLIPDFVLGASGFGGSPHAVVDTGGKSFGDSAEDLVKTLESVAKALDKAAGLASTLASYQRRKDDWDNQKNMADKEIEQLDRQIAAGEIKVTIAQTERDNQVIQIENATAVDEFMRSKYTNQELYQWQVSQISGVYFQSYKLAYDLAKRAERCLRFELGLQDSSYITYGYWDSLRKGLLSGEQLQYDLRRLEAAYLEQNRREFEITKHISLALLDPVSLVQLRETGRCFFDIPEEIFDLDFPGHYFRRIKSVSITLPCVVGPYTSVSCTLRLLKNSIRVNTANGDNGYPRNVDDAGLPASDDRFVENNVPFKAIAASSGQADSGVFELSFRDDRYIPFEGAGAISSWALELFNDLPANNPDPANPDFGRPLRQWPYETLSDAIIQVRLTAREDAGRFKNAAIAHLRDYYSTARTTPGVLMLSLRRDFPTEWARFLRPANPALGNVLSIQMVRDLFAYRDADHTLQVNMISVIARCTNAGNYGVTLTPPLPAPPPAGSNALTLVRSSNYGGLHFAQKDVSAAGVALVPTDPVQTWALTMTRPGGGNLTEDPATHDMEVADVIVILGYGWA